MAFFSRWLHTVRRWLARGRVEQDLDAELRAYTDLLADEQSRTGLAPDAARRAALLATGGIEPVKEAVRDARTGVWLESVAADLRYAVRSLTRMPGFTLAAVLALGLGIGANAAIFSVVSGVLLRPLPYGDPDRLVTILHGEFGPVGPRNYLDWKAQSTSFAGMAAAEYWAPNLSGSEQSEYVRGIRITPDMLSVLGVRPLLGRDLAPDTDAPGRDTELLLSHRLWQRVFGADPAVLGRTVQLNGTPYTVVGIMPPDFQFAPYWVTNAELWVPLSLAARADSRTGRSLRIFARLAEGTSIERARAELAQITARLDAEFPGTNRDVQVHDLRERAVGFVRGPLLVLLAAVGFVLLIACANVAHMLLARATARRREMALRAALGAGRGRIVRQLLTESLVLSGAGALLGLALAWAGIVALRNLGPYIMPRLDAVRLDAPVFLFLLGAALLTGVGFGLVPALSAAAPGLADALKDGARGAEGGRTRLRAVLVASEFALALVLLVGAGLMVRTFAGLRALTPGFDTERVLTMVVSTQGAPSGEPGRRWPFYEDLIARARALPGVEAAAAMNHVPFAGDIWGRNFTIEGAPPPADPDDTPNAVYRLATPGLFAALGVRLLAGRDLAATDRLDQPGVVVVSQHLARTWFADTDPVGRRIQLGGDTTWLTIVGVVSDVRQSVPADPQRAELYLPVTQIASFMRDTLQRGGGYLSLVVRAAGDPAALAAPMRALVRELDRAATVSQVLTTREIDRMATAREQFYLTLLGAFAAVALALAAIGIYGTMSYAVAQRRLEFGIRMALGAHPARIVRQVTGQALRLTVMGAGIGLVASLLLTRLMRGMLYGVGATNAATFGSALLVLGLVALAAAVIPAVRAGRVAPTQALRDG